MQAANAKDIAASAERFADKLNAVVLLVVNTSLYVHLPGETALDSWLPPLEAALQAAETGVHR